MSVEQVPPPLRCSCDGVTAPNVGFLPKVNTTNLYKKFWANLVNRQRDEQMEWDGNKSPVQLYWQSSKHENMQRSSQKHRLSRKRKDTLKRNINFTSPCLWLTLCLHIAARLVIHKSHVSALIFGPSIVVLSHAVSLLCLLRHVASFFQNICSWLRAQTGPKFGENIFRQTPGHKLKTRM